MYVVERVKSTGREERKEKEVKATSPPLKPQPSSSSCADPLQRQTGLPHTPFLRYSAFQPSHDRQERKLVGEGREGRCCERGGGTRYGLGGR
jgi:hypothetical protein